MTVTRFEHPLHGELSVAVIADITERRRYEDQPRELADHDPLTGLLNRRSFQRELNAHLTRMTRLGRAGAVMMIDLDNFKHYNDTSGHSAGDELIVRVARAIGHRLRESDVVARLGGDEFAVLLPGDGAAGAERVARLMLERIEQQVPSSPIDGCPPITASIGIACFEQVGAVSAEETLALADRAMYDAKEQGRNRFSFRATDRHERPLAASSPSQRAVH